MKILLIMLVVFLKVIFSKHFLRLYYLINHTMLFFFSFFKNNINLKVNKTYVLSNNLRRFILHKINIKKYIKSTAKNIKKTFKLNDYFFSKVFFISFYKFIIVTIKIFNRFFKLKKQKHLHFISTSTYF